MPPAPDIKAARADDLPSLHTFVNDLERDLAAAGLYSRAGLRLPRKRGLLAS